MLAAAATCWYGCTVTARAAPQTGHSYTRAHVYAAMAWASGLSQGGWRPARPWSERVGPQACEHRKRRLLAAVGEVINPDCQLSGDGLSLSMNHVNRSMLGFERAISNACRRYAACFSQETPKMSSGGLVW